MLTATEKILKKILGEQQKQTKLLENINQKLKKEYAATINVSTDRAVEVINKKLEEIMKA